MRVRSRLLHWCIASSGWLEVCGVLGKVLQFRWSDRLWRAGDCGNVVTDLRINDRYCEGNWWLRAGERMLQVSKKRKR